MCDRQTGLETLKRLYYLQLDSGGSLSIYSYMDTRMWALAVAHDRHIDFNHLVGIALAGLSHLADVSYHPAD